MALQVVFVDRDGTLIREPADYKIDSFEKLSFLPFALSSMRRLVEHGYALVMVTNQDGLGTEALPLDAFHAVHNKILEIFLAEGVQFKAVFIDHHHEHENHPNRKPGIGMLETFLQTHELDYENCFMLGDRTTDAAFARNLGVSSITVKDPHSHDGDLDIHVPVEPAPTHIVRSLPEAVDYILAHTAKRLEWERQTVGL